jgi:hypothetical protein
MLDFEVLLTLPDVFFEDSEMPAPPARTLLYGLAPISLGTPYCESFKSFVFRLAHEHRLSPTQLILDVVWKHLSPEVQATRNTYNRKLLHSPCFNFAGKITRVLTAAVEELTGSRGLECCTLLPFAGVLNPSSLAAGSERFCPQCIRELDSGAEVSAERLRCLRQ